MNLEQQLLKLIDYLMSNNVYNHHYYLKDKNNIQIESAFSLTNRGEIDGAKLSLNFKNKESELYSYCESRHNGDHYDCRTETIEWNQAIEYAFTRLKELILKHLKQEKEKQLKLELDRQVEQQFNILFL